MLIDPELGRRLGQAKIEEARSRMQQAPALRAASLERQTPALKGAERPNTWTLAMLSAVSGWRGRRTVRRSAPRTTNG